MVALLVALFSVIACLPSLAQPSAAPELDPGSLAALTSALTGAYFVYRVYQKKTRSLSGK